MPNTPNGRGNYQLVAPTTTDLYNPHTLLNRLKNAGIDDRLLHILQAFLSEKAKSTDPGDRKYLIDLLTEIHILLREYSSTDLKIMLMQRLIIFGVNHPKLTTYYYDAFVSSKEKTEPKNLKKLISRLIQKTEVTELYPLAYQEFPSLKESLQTQLDAWIKTVEKEEYGFHTVAKNNQGPIVKLNVPAGVFMNIYRAMEETGLIETTVSHKQLYSFLSQVFISNKFRKIQAETLRNGFVYDNPKEIEKARCYLIKMQESLEEMQDMVLRK
ncbi:hypothetical protein [Albibacterium indicum]|uniref:hypothetical protein n=1 Tax=Albibacterium indicum TaxID=2292082 RepID=UPI000E4CC477|nr:hypothetical protein [Pedobacter indicus]